MKKRHTTEQIAAKRGSLTGQQCSPSSLSQSRCTAYRAAVPDPFVLPGQRLPIVRLSRRGSC